MNDSSPAKKAIPSVTSGMRIPALLAITSF